MDTPPTRLLSVTSAAEQLDCSRGHIYGLIAAGKLAAVDISAQGGRAKTRVLASELEDMITRATRRASAPAATWPSVLPQPRPDLHPHHALMSARNQATYGTTEAAARLLLRVRDVPTRSPPATCTPTVPAPAVRGLSTTSACSPGPQASSAGTAAREVV